MTIIFEQHQEAVKYIGHCDFVDNELSKQLDSTEAFEGPEKTIEVEFLNKDVNLNKLSIEQWTELLEPVECQILSRISSEEEGGETTISASANATMDVYLLSESTLVVHGSKMMLKTCGTTSTLRVLGPLFAVVGGAGGGKEAPPHPVRVRYSRPELKFPERQKDPVHVSWEREVAQLEAMLGAGAEETRCAEGNTWHCWRSAGWPAGQAGQAEKVEIIMHDLDEEACALFEREPRGDTSIDPDDDDAPIDDPHSVGMAMLERSGLGRVLRGKRDAFAFAPRGWSANSVAGGVAGAQYSTVHVTPERGCSYASYEAVVGGVGGVNEVEEIVRVVLGVFRPRRYCVVWH